MLGASVMQEDKGDVAPKEGRRTMAEGFTRDSICRELDWELAFGEPEELGAQGRVEPGEMGSML